MASTLHVAQPSSRSSISLANRQSNGDSASFQGRPPSFSSLPPTHHQSQLQMHNPSPYPSVASQPSQENLAHQSSGSFPSFSEIGNERPQPSGHQPQIYTAVYSSVAVYEMEVHGVAVMRRRSDSWLNATQILKVAGVEKGKRTKILEKEILTGHHEKIQGGYGKYQGTWINYRRGREFCRQYGVEDILRPLLDYDMGPDGSCASGHVDTPTKEQAMAANRKRFYTSNVDGRSSSNGSGNTFFQNISPTASNALAAMNKAARFESPMPRPGSAQRRPPAVQRRQSSQQQPTGQESFYQSESQQSTQSFGSDHAETNGVPDPIYVPMVNTVSEAGMNDVQEPPRKRIRPSTSQDPYLDPILQDETPTEPSDSFVQQHFARESEQGPLSLPPLSISDDKAGEEKRLALLDLFADSTRTDFSSHTAILHLCGKDLDIPLDASANTALHWAATLGRVILMRLLISRGANIFRGNAAGQTPLMAAVQVNNSLDHSCFNEILETLGPLIEIRDATGRTVLHHIAVSSGIKGRSQSSRYYLESLLAFTVRQGSNSVFNSQQESFPESQFPGVHSEMRPITLARFMADVVNVQDKSGNTALNLVARIGNHVIINQLDEVGADYTIANHTGFRPTDFGVFPRSQAMGKLSSSQQSSADGNTPNQIEQIRDEIFATTTSILTQTNTHYTTELTKSQTILDAQTAELRDIAAQHQTEIDELEKLQQQAKKRRERHQKILNLRNSFHQERVKSRGQLTNSPLKSSDIDQENATLLKHWAVDADSLPSPDSTRSSHAVGPALERIPSESRLRTLFDAYSKSNDDLSSQVKGLKSRSSELEAQYRKVVSLCTGVEEKRVEEVLSSLVAAVESEGARGAGAGRVREFLRLVEGADGAHPMGEN